MATKPDVITIFDILVKKGIEPELAAEITKELAREWDFLSQKGAEK